MSSNRNNNNKGDVLLAAAACSALAYSDDIAPGSLQAFVPASFENLTPVALVGDDRCWIMRDPTRRAIVVAFRGSDSVGDILRGFKFRPARFVTGAPCTVHSGFMDYYMGTRAELLEALADAATPDYSVVFTGHSLGGATATMAALEHQLVTTPPAARREVYCVTFGSPPTGDQRFVRLFDRAIDRSYRFVCGADMTPRIPIPGMKHVKGGIYLPRRPDGPSSLITHHNIKNYMEPLRSRFKISRIL